MPHVIEAATTGRSKCRGCGGTIAQRTLRFGERIANPFGGGEATLWFHLQCAAYRRPEALLATLDGADLPPADAAKLRADAQLGVALHRLPRIDGVGLSTGARARCRDCHELIAKGEWRIPVVFFAEGAFHRRGFVHVALRRSLLRNARSHRAAAPLHARSRPGRPRRHPARARSVNAARRARAVELHYPTQLAHTEREI